MNPEQRAVVAGIAAALVNGRPYQSVYDHEARCWLSVAVEVSAGRVEAYDRLRRTYVRGELPGGVFDHGRGAFLDFNRDGLSVRGYDHGSASFFEAIVSGDAISLFDYEDGRWRSFEAG